MTLSINSNASALSVLQALNAANEQLNVTEGRVSTGLQVAVAKDNPAVWSLAQSQRSELSSLSNVTDGLNRAQSISDVAVSAGQTISDLLNQIRVKALAADDTTLDAPSLQALNADYQTLLRQISNTLQSASFGGVNLVNGSQTSGVSFLATADGQGQLTLAAQNLSLGGAILTLPAVSDISTPTAAQTVLSEVNASIGQVNTAVATLGAQNDQVVNHASFVSTLASTLTTGLGGLVDADVAAESARLSALQVQQQLSVQTLSIANQQPSLILTLLRNG